MNVYLCNQPTLGQTPSEKWVSLDLKEMRWLFLFAPCLPNGNLGKSCITHSCHASLTLAMHHSLLPKSKRSPSVSLQISSPHFTNQMLAVSLHASMALCFVQRSDFFDKAAKRAAKATRFSVASYGSYGSGKFEPQKKQVAGHRGQTKTNVLKCQPAEYTCMKLHAGKSLFS